MKCEYCKKKRVLMLYPNGICKECHENVAKYKIAKMVRDKGGKRNEPTTSR